MCVILKIFPIMCYKSSKTSILELGFNIKVFIIILIIIHTKRTEVKNMHINMYWWVFTNQLFNKVLHE